MRQAAVALHQVAGQRPVMRTWKLEAGSAIWYQWGLSRSNAR
jgi:hypothetical protein